MSSTGLPKLGSVLYQTFVEFPCSALTIPRQSDPNVAAMSSRSANGDSSHTIKNSLVQSCQSPESVSCLLGKDPSLTPGEAWKKLTSHKTEGLHTSQHISDDGKDRAADHELDLAYACGSWGPNRPSDLFLKLYHDSLSTLNEHPDHGMVSPSLLGSNGVAPLTIISVIPDIVRHMSNLIVRADREVFLATNYWQNSVASAFITNAMKELSRRAGERGTRIVMKVIYDRGSPKQLFEPHYIVSEKEYTGKAVGLPAKHEIPNIDLEVMNYHDPLLGTFHSKFMVVDRKIGIVQSNNIQDNDNLEMMVHVEGPIVDGLYDMALLSWHKRLDPSLPSRDSSAAEGGTQRSSPSHDIASTSNRSLETHPPKTDQRAAAFGPQADEHLAPDLTPSALKNTEPPVGGSDSAEGHSTGQVLPANATNDSHHFHQTDATGSETQGRPQCKQQEALPEHTAEDPHYDIDIAGEIARVQVAVSAKPHETQLEAITRHLNHTTNKDVKGDPAASSQAEEMTPYISHPTHEPFPIALVNRSPYGPPNHKSVSNPQNAAWLSALRNATKNVFIQSPTLNAEPLVPAIIQACERGIDVYCYICLGYNDAGELLPMQGGHNEMVANHLYKAMSLSARQHLHYFWYVGKDQTRPIVAESKRRSCHIKLMIVDECIGIVGSGNQDTQSWFHSQEVNIMLESREVCAQWIEGLRRNQNTHRYGAVGRDDGVWRDADGKEAQGATGVDPGHFSWAKGLVGAVKRVKGTGGF
ncbi:hypothetical protein JX266_001853 [Neoarthrinium moseri]|nr:hypothetical protein JX266_001853 [Neoarthrinium moseri]